MYTSKKKKITGRSPTPQRRRRRFHTFVRDAFNSIFNFTIFFFFWFFLLAIPSYGILQHNIYGKIIILFVFFKFFLCFRARLAHITAGNCVMSTISFAGAHALRPGYRLPINLRWTRRRRGWSRTLPPYPVNIKWRSIFL